LKEAYCIQSNDERVSLHAKRTMRSPARVWGASAGSLAWALLCLGAALPGRCFAWALLCLALHQIEEACWHRAAEALDALNAR